MVRERPYLALGGWLRLADGMISEPFLCAPILRSRSRAAGGGALRGQHITGTHGEDHGVGIPVSWSGGSYPT